MRRVLVGLVIAVAGSASCSPVADGIGRPHGGHSLLIRTPTGASVDQATLQEPAGIIREFRVAAAARIRVRVTVVIPGLAGVSASLPRTHLDNSGTCSRHGGFVACVQAEEACPMPAASWHVRVRKLSGPAGPVRVDFVVGPSGSR